MPIDLTQYTKQSTLSLITTGRKSGRQRAVKIWFAVADPHKLYVQHVRGPSANWYKNLLMQPGVQLDFGQGPVPARATPIADPAEVRHVLTLIRRKYIFAWVFQLLGMTRHAVAAEIIVES